MDALPSSFDVLSLNIAWKNCAKMSDTWTEIQEHKRRQESLRDRLQRRRKERRGIGVQDSDLSGLLPMAMCSCAL